MSSPRSDLSVGGPVAGAHWEIRQAGAGEGRPLSLLVLPDSSNTNRVSAGLPPLFHYLPQLPRLAIDRGNRPIFSLTLVLQRQPYLDEDDLEPLIERGILAMTLTLNVPEAPVAELAKTTQAEYQPLFTRQAVFSLISEDATNGILSEQTSGAGSWAAMSAQLGREDTLKVLAAIKGGESGMLLNGQITYRTAPSAGGTLLLQGDWGQVYEFLQSQIGVGGEISQEALAAAFEEMIQAGLLEASYEDDTQGTGPVQDTAPFFRPFLRLSSIILQRQTLDLEIEDTANRYLLRPYAPTGMALSVRHVLAASSGRDEFIELPAPLEEVLVGAFEGQDLEAFIRLVCPTGGGGGFGPAPRRVKMARPKAMPGSQPVRLAAIKGSAGSLSLALRPSAQIRPRPDVLLTSDVVRPSALAHPLRPQLWAVDDMVVGHGGPLFGSHQPTVLNLPIVEDQSAPLWSDRLEANRFWYPPIFTPVTPALNADPANSAFLFSFTASGHDLSGQTGLDGAIHLTLKQGMSAATKAAIKAKGNAKAAPVALTSLSVSLELPFRDQTGATRKERFPAELKQMGDTVKVTFRLVNEWVRLLYGVLAFAGFQSEPARLLISYTYKAYVPVDSNRLNPLFGGKIAKLEVVQKPDDLVTIGRKSYLDARDGTFHLPSGVFQLARELPIHREGPPESSQEDSRSQPAARAKDKSQSQKKPPSSKEKPELSSVTTAVAERSEAERETARFRPANLTAVAVSPTVTALPIAAHPMIAIRPELQVIPVFEGVLPEKQYALQSLGTSQRSDVLYPCEDYGALYVQETAEGLQTVACTDVLKLGQTEYKQYRLLTDPNLRSPLYSIYRSLQMPERFLVLPTTYRITRFGADEGEKAYRPAIFLYSTIKAERLEESRCTVSATLQPDIPAYARRELAEKLNKLSHRLPLIEYVTEIESQVEYEWSIPTTGPHPIQVDVAKLWDSFQVSMTTDVDSVPQLQALLEGGVVSAGMVFTLPDGSQMQSELRLNLREITGPWEGGPLEARLQAGNASLTNRIESGINVSDLHLYLPDQKVQLMRVDRLLKPDENWTAPAPAGAAEIYPVYTLQPGGPASLPEIRSFIEEIYTNIIFFSQVTFANHNLKKLDITARIKELEGTYHVSLPDDQTSASLDIILPLTSFLANPVLQFQVIKTDTSDQTSRTPWLDWPLATRGVVVSLTWALINESQT